jgi:hypothetical protein
MKKHPENLRFRGEIRTNIAVDRKILLLRGEGAKTTRKGWFYSFQTVGGAPPV